jgi:hypothetical protein
MRWLSFAVVLGMVALPDFAWAWLGGDAASVASDRERMNANVTETSGLGYTSYDIQTPSGTLVREFVSPDGLVFAVAWKGPSLPDMRQLLGPYFDRYVNSTNALGAGAGTRVVDEPGFAAYAGGHMRGFVGRAYIPESIPAGVNVADIH